jgi:hypothetical protein
MPSQRYYVGAWTNNDIFSHCDHQHKTMASAVACAGSVCAGSYVVAIEDGQLEQLEPWEEALYQRLMYGKPERLERLIRWFGRMHLIVS